MILTLVGVWIIFINYIKYIFMHMKKGWLFAGITIIFLIIGIVFYFGAYKRNDYSLNAVKYCYGVLKDKFYGVYVRVFMDKNNRYLDVNEVLVKLMIKEGENIEKNILSLLYHKLNKNLINIQIPIIFIHKNPYINTVEFILQNTITIFNSIQTIIIPLIKKIIVIPANSQPFFICIKIYFI